MGGDTAGPLGAAYCITFPMANGLTALRRLGPVMDCIFNIQMAAFAFLPAAVPPLTFDPQLLAQLTIQQTALQALINGTGTDLNRIVFILQSIADLFWRPSVFQQFRNFFRKIWFCQLAFAHAPLAPMLVSLLGLQGAVFASASGVPANLSADG